MEFIVIFLYEFYGSLSGIWLELQYGLDWSELAARQKWTFDV